GPSITSLNPPSKPQRSSFILTVVGSGFAPGAVVLAAGAVLQTTFVSSTGLTAVVPDGMAACARAFPVQVFNSYPAGPASNFMDLTIAGVQPSVAGLSPSSILAGAPGFNLTVKGAGFLSCDCPGGPLTVKWNNQPLVVTGSVPTQVTAAVPAALIASAGTASITVANPGSTLFSDPLSFPIVGPLAVTCVPAAGPAQTGVVYASACAASGGTPPYNWSIGAGALPPGLSLGAATGSSVTISGAPTATGAYSYTVRAADSASPSINVATQSFSGTIVSAPPPALSPAGWWSFDVADIVGNQSRDKSA